MSQQKYLFFADTFWTKLQKPSWRDSPQKNLYNWAFGSDTKHRNQATQFCNIAHYIPATNKYLT